MHLALRGLGLSLRQIKALLIYDQASFADVLTFQRHGLTAQRGKLEAAIALRDVALLALEAGSMVRTSRRREVFSAT